MDKQKQIEDMTKLVDWNCDNKSMDYCEKVKDCYECRAIDLYNVGYRKIPEGAVVLIPTEEKYAILSQKELEQITKKACKETAEKFAGKLKKIAAKEIARTIFDNFVYYRILEDDIDEICKEFTENK